MRRSAGTNERVMGTYDDNPTHNDMASEVEFLDVQVKEHSANILAESMLIREDEDDFSTTLFDSIAHFKKE